MFNLVAVFGAGMIAWGTNWQVGLGIVAVYLAINQMFHRATGNLLKVNNNLVSTKPVRFDFTNKN